MLKLKKFIQLRPIFTIRQLRKIWYRWWVISFFFFSSQFLSVMIISAADFLENLSDRKKYIWKRKKVAGFGLEGFNLTPRGKVNGVILWLSFSLNIVTWRKKFFFNLNTTWVKVHLEKISPMLWHNKLH